MEKHKMNLGLENLVVVDEPIEKTPIDMQALEHDLEEQVRAWVAEADRDEKLSMVSTITECLASAKAEDESLMSFVKEDLMALGINCESNEVAAAELKAFMETVDVETSQEFILIEALVIAGAVALYLAIVVTLIALFDDLAVWTADIVSKNEAIFDKGLRSEPKDENKEILVLSFDKFMKLMTAHSAAIGIFATNAKEFTTAKMDEIHKLMKGASMVWDGKNYNAVDQYRFIKQTTQKAGWNPDTLKKAQAEFVALAKELVVFKQLRKQAEEAAKKAKAVETKEMSKEEAKAAKTEAKEKAADMKKANGEMKKYAAMAKWQVMACGWTMQRALSQYAK